MKETGLLPWQPNRILCYCTAWSDLNMLYGFKNGHIEFVNMNLHLYWRCITKQCIFILIQVGLFMPPMCVHKGCVLIGSLTLRVVQIYVRKWIWHYCGCYQHLFGFYKLTVSQSRFTGASIKSLSKHPLFLEFCWVVFTHPWRPHPQDFNDSGSLYSTSSRQTCHFHVIDSYK